jgi:hypothetical protein
MGSSGRTHHESVVRRTCPLFLYQVSITNGYNGSIIDFMNEAVKQSYVKVGWGFSRSYNEELNEYHSLN